MKDRSRQILVATFALILACALCTGLCPAQDQKARLERDYNVTPVPFNQVHVEDGFWTARLRPTNS